jgi:GH24 family phage-related lysozyme (muramidase)
MDPAIVIPRIETFEGRMPFMYLCTGGEVTIGIGHAILRAADAAALSWSIGGSAATADEIAADWERVAAAEKGRIALAYQGLTTCRMSNNDIEALIASDVELFTAQLARTLPNWSTYPEPAQEALFDMGFNLGIGGLKRFPHMLAAVDAGQWEIAAAQCHRQGISDARNQQTADLFRQAAG